MKLYAFLLAVFLAVALLTEDAEGRSRRRRRRSRGRRQRACVQDGKFPNDGNTVQITYWYGDKTVKDCCIACQQFNKINKEFGGIWCKAFYFRPYNKENGCPAKCGLKKAFASDSALEAKSEFKYAELRSTCNSDEEKIWCPGDGLCRSRGRGRGRGKGRRGKGKKKRRKRRRRRGKGRRRNKGRGKKNMDYLDSDDIGDSEEDDPWSLEDDDDDSDDDDDDDSGHMDYYEDYEGAYDDYYEDYEEDGTNEDNNNSSNQDKSENDDGQKK